MSDRSSSPAPPLLQRPGVLRFLLVVVSIAFLWVVFADSDDDEWEDFDEAGYAADAWMMDEVMTGYPDVAAPPGFVSAPPASGYTEYATGYQGYQQAPPQTGYGYGESGAFRGRAEVGGMPQVHGTIDNSGEGNHVFSVGGEVLDLP